VLTQSGFKSIELIRQGDAVQTVRTSGRLGCDLNRVERVEICNSKTLTLVVNSQIIRTTDTHPILTDARKWQLAKNLIPGERLFSAEGREIRVTSLESGPVQTVYNLVIEKSDSFQVGNPEWDFSITAGDRCSTPSTEPSIYKSLRFQAKLMRVFDTKTVRQLPLPAVLLESF
jgi:hypothetical protein